MSYERLFTAAAPISPEEHLPDAEIYASPLSRYVLDELPQDLSAIRANQLSYTDLAAKHAALLAEAEPSMLQNEDPHTAKITQLDLVFMLGSYIPTGSVFEAAPADLLLKLRQQSAYFGLPPLMTYDLVVNANSAEYLRTGQMRTFTTGETGRHERDFYLGHYQAEPFARSATEKLKQIIENTDNPGQYKLLQEGAQDVATLRRYMDAYLRFNPDDFAVIRPYLAKYPNQKPNASGAFMPGPQLLELALSPPTGGHVTYLQESGPYFPRYDQSLVRRATQLSQKGQNIIDLLQAGRLQLDADSTVALARLIDEFIQFRMAHLAATRRQIPKAFPPDTPRSRDAIRQFGEQDIFDEGSMPGTAGFNAEHVLIGAISRLLELKDLSKAY